MQFNLVPMDESVAERIANWHYDPPYDFYDLEADPEDYAEFMDPASWADTYAVEDGDGRLVGFFTFSPQDGAVEIGLGMHPNWTGRGLGQKFIEAGLEFARARYGAATFELAVATFNKRAISVYKGFGFERVETYWQRTNGGEHEFLRMRRG
jgi:ribosomal-protein-alanine N-acetyltransferase